MLVPCIGEPQPICTLKPIHYSSKSRVFTRCIAPAGSRYSHPYPMRLCPGGPCIVYIQIEIQKELSALSKEMCVKLVYNHRTFDASISLSGKFHAVDAKTFRSNTVKEKGSLITIRLMREIRETRVIFPIAGSTFSTPLQHYFQQAADALKCPGG